MSANDNIKESLEDLKAWFKDNPKLPEEIHPTLLKRFLKCCDMNVENTKKLIEHNFYLRNRSPNMFIERDPNDEATQKSYLHVEKVPLPGLTPDNHKIICFRLVNGDASLQNSLEESKAYFMMTDARFTYPDSHEDYTTNSNKDVDIASLADGEIHIMDIANYTLRHMTSSSFLIMRTYMNYMQEAYPIRLKAMHVINCPSYLNRMLAIAKPFIREDVLKMYTFHTESIDALYDHVPRDMLPVDYGGKARSLADISNDWWNIVKNNRDYLMDPKHWRIAKEENRSRWLWW